MNLSTNNIYKLIPSMVTVSAFGLGFFAMLVAIYGNINKAILLIALAGILDLLDGRLARILSVDSSFGAELDSFSDFLCFGVALSITVIFFQNPYSKLILFSSFLYSLAIMLRLARFNLHEEVPAHLKGYFLGIPSPAAFSLAILPMAIYYIFGYRVSDITYAVYLTIISILVLSNFPTISTKKLKISKKYSPLFLLFFAIFIFSLIFYTLYVSLIFNILYVSSIFISGFIVTKNKKNLKLKEDTINS